MPTVLKLAFDLYTRFQTLLPGIVSQEPSFVLVNPVYVHSPWYHTAHRICTVVYRYGTHNSS